jgi:hypothetical protein
MCAGPTNGNAITLGGVSAMPASEDCSVSMVVGLTNYIRGLNCRAKVSKIVIAATDFIAPLADGFSLADAISEVDSDPVLLRSVGKPYRIIEIKNNFLLQHFCDNPFH